MIKVLQKFGLVAVIMMVLIVAACSGGNSGSSGGNSGSGGTSSGSGTQTPAASDGSVEADAGNEPITMRFMFRGQKQATHDYVVKKVKERFNVDLVYEYTDRDIYAEKLNVAFAGNNAADFVYMSDKPMIANAAANGALVPVTDFIQNDPYWSSLNDGYYQWIDGQIYEIPAMINLPQAMYYRTDWAETLNLKLPTNEQELYDFMYAMAHGDPDQNNKKDTYGMTLQPNMYGGETIFRLFIPGDPYRNLAMYHDVADDTIKTSYYLNEDFKDALQWLRKAYAEEVLDPEWLIDNSSTSEDKFITGKIGTWVKGVPWVKPRLVKMQQANPNAAFEIVPMIQGRYATNYAETDGARGDYFITSSTKDPERAIQVMAYLQSAEGMKDTTLGEEGVHYKVENEEVVFLVEGLDEYNPGNFVTSVHTDMVLPAPEPILEDGIQAIQGYTMFKDISGFVQASDTYIQKSADMQKGALEMMAKVILGEQPIESFDQFVDGIRKDMDQILNEVNANYKASK